MGYYFHELKLLYLVANMLRVGFIQALFLKFLNQFLNKKSWILKILYFFIFVGFFFFFSSGF